MPSPPPMRYTVDVAVQTEPASLFEHCANEPYAPEQAEAVVNDESLGGPLQLVPEEWPTPEELDTMERAERMLEAPREVERPAPAVILYQHDEEEGEEDTRPLEAADWPSPQEAQLCPQERPPPAARNPSLLLAQLVARGLAAHSAADSPQDELSRRLQDSGIHCNEDTHTARSEGSPEEDPSETKLKGRDGDGGGAQ